jgi:hypothetical protein
MYLYSQLCSMNSCIYGISVFTLSETKHFTNKYLLMVSVIVNVW